MANAICGRKSRSAALVLCISSVVLVGLCACTGFVETDSEALSGLGFATSLTGQTDGTNVVVSYTNDTDQPAQWSIVWAGRNAEPTTVTATTGPGKTGILSLEGPVTSIALGSLDGEVPAVILGSSEGAIEVPGTVGPLIVDLDFHPGDIVSFTLAQSPDGEPVITTEITPGG